MHQPTGITKSSTATAAEGCDNCARNSTAETYNHTGEVVRDNAQPFGVFRFGRQPLLDIVNTAGTVQPPAWPGYIKPIGVNGGSVVYGDVSEYCKPSIEHKDMAADGALSHSVAVNTGQGGHAVGGYVVKGANTAGGAKNDTGGVCTDVRSPFSQYVAETDRPQVKTVGVKRQRVIDGDRDGAVGKENDNPGVSKGVAVKLSTAHRSKYNRLSLKSRVRRNGPVCNDGASCQDPLETPISVSTHAEEEIPKPRVQTPCNTDGAARDAHNTAAPPPEPRSPFQTAYVYEDISDADEGVQGLPSATTHTPNNQNTDFFEPLNNALNALAPVCDDAGAAMPGSQSLTPEQIRAEFHHLVRITCDLPPAADDACALNTLTLAAEELMVDISTQSAYSAAHELIQVCNTDIEQRGDTDVETDSAMCGECAAEEGLCEDAQGTSTQDLVRDTIHWQTPTSASANTQPVSIPQPQNTAQPDIIVIHSDDESDGGCRPSVIKLNTHRVALPNAEKYCKADAENNTLKTRPPIDVVTPHPTECVLTRPKKHKNKSSGADGDTPRGYTPSPAVGAAVRGYTPSASVPHAHVSSKRKSTSGDNSTPGAKYRRMMAAGKRVLRRCAGLAKTPENAGIFEHYEMYFDRALDKEGELTKVRETDRDQPWRPVPPGAQWYQTPLNPPSSGGLTHFVQIGGPAGRMVRVVEDGERPSTSAGAVTGATGRAVQPGGQHPA